jgi:Ca2+-transporting ATPase
MRRSNRALWYVAGGAIVFLAAAVYLPALQAIFLFAPISPLATVVSAAAGLSSLIAFEASKMVFRRREPQ